MGIVVCLFVLQVFKFGLFVCFYSLWFTMMTHMALGSARALVYEDQMTNFLGKKGGEGSRGDTHTQ